MVTIRNQVNLKYYNFKNIRQISLKRENLNGEVNTNYLTNFVNVTFTTKIGGCLLK